MRVPVISTRQVPEAMSPSPSSNWSHISLSLPAATSQYSRSSCQTQTRPEPPVFLQGFLMFLSLKVTPVVEPGANTSIDARAFSPKAYQRLNTR